MMDDSVMLPIDLNTAVDGVDHALPLVSSKASTLTQHVEYFSSVPTFSHHLHYPVD